MHSPQINADEVDLLSPLPSGECRWGGVYNIIMKIACAAKNEGSFLPHFCSVKWGRQEGV
jgi:hypothetical protein